MPRELKNSRGVVAFEMGDFAMLFELIWIAISLVWRTSSDLNAPTENLPPNASRGAAWAGLGIGLAMLGVLLFIGIASVVESSRPDGRYGTINGIHVSRSDFDACGGKIPEGCPNGNMMLYKYIQLGRARG